MFFTELYFFCIQGTDNNIPEHSGEAVATTTAEAVASFTNTLSYSSTSNSTYEINEESDGTSPCDATPVATCSLQSLVTTATAVTVSTTSPVAVIESLPKTRRRRKCQWLTRKKKKTNNASSQPDPPLLVNTVKLKQALPVSHDRSQEINKLAEQEKIPVVRNVHIHQVDFEISDDELPSLTDEPDTLPLFTDEPKTLPSFTDEPRTLPSITDKPKTLPSITDEPKTSLSDALSKTPENTPPPLTNGPRTRSRGQTVKPPADTKIRVTQKKKIAGEVKKSKTTRGKTKEKSLPAISSNAPAVESKKASIKKKSSARLNSLKNRTNSAVKNITSVTANEISTVPSTNCTDTTGTLKLPLSDKACEFRLPFSTDGNSSFPTSSTSVPTMSSDNPRESVTATSASTDQCFSPCPSPEHIDVKPALAELDRIIEKNKKSEAERNGTSLSLISPAKEHSTVKKSHANSNKSQESSYPLRIKTEPVEESEETCLPGFDFGSVPNSEDQEILSDSIVTNIGEFVSIKSSPPHDSSEPALLGDAALPLPEDAEPETQQDERSDNLSPPQENVSPKAEGDDFATASVDKANPTVSGEIRPRFYRNSTDEHVPIKGKLDGILMVHQCFVTSFLYGYIYYYIYVQS